MTKNRIRMTFGISLCLCALYLQGSTKDEAEALQLPFAIFLLLHFASSRKRMGKWRIGWFLLMVGWGSALLITVFDFYGLPEKRFDEFLAAGIPTQSELAYGDPVTERVKWIVNKGCNLVAMSTHGHRFLADLFLGTTASLVQHNVTVPVLWLKAR